MVRRLSFAVLLIGSSAFAAYPRVRALEESWIADCLTAPRLENGEWAGAAEWTLSKCTPEEFILKVGDEPGRSPAARLLAARIVRAAVVERRDATAKSFVEKPRTDELPGVMGDTSFLGLFTKLVQSPNLLPPPVPFETIEGAILQKTQALVEKADAWLVPLTAPGSVLAAEAVLERVRLLGDSLRFGACADVLASQGNLLQPQSLAREAIKLSLDWTDRFGAMPLRPWLRGRLESLRPSAITGSRAEHLTYWLKSLEFAGAPPASDKDAATALVARLRDLWVNYPLPKDGAAIRKTSEVLGLSKKFSPPSPRDMTLPELIARAQAHVRAVDAPSALRVLARVMSLSKNELDPDRLWQALQLHIKVLRINDQRPLIPRTMAKYIAVGHYLEAPKAGAPDAEWGGMLSRATDIVRSSWSYDEPAKAEALADRVLKMAAKGPAKVVESSVGQLLYLKARMAEQKKNTASAKPIFAAALQAKLPQDVASDLLWRNLLLHFDLVREKLEPATELLTLFDPLKKYLVDPVDKARWHYWQAQAFALNVPAGAEPVPVPEAAKITEAKVDEEYKKAYDAEPYSFYSNLAGLELTRRGSKPDRWQLGGGRPEYEIPSWTRFFSAEGTPHHVVYRDLARTYFLASIGDFDGALTAAGDTDAALWDRLLSSKSPVHDKDRYARAIAWLRLALLDPMGSLRAAEVARQAYGANFTEDDFFYLYPLPHWDRIQSESGKWGLNPWLAASLIRQESAFNERARSWANAIGLMQMIPVVANAEAKMLGLENFNIEQLYEPAISLQLGVHHLADRVAEMNGSWICAAAAYNAGAPPVLKWLKNYDTSSPVAFIERISFVETRNYVRAILRNYMNYRRIYADGEFDLEPILKMPPAKPDGINSLLDETARSRSQESPSPSASLGGGTRVVEATP